MRRLPFIGLLCLFASLIARAHGQAQPELLQKVGPTVHAPVPITSPEAEMPDEARRLRQGGICLISMIVDSKGEPTNPHLVRCTDSMFAKNSMDTVMKYRFKPAIRVTDGISVPVMITIEINFRFTDRPFSPDEPPTRIRYGFFSPPGMTSLGPDADGVYPLSKQLEAPKMAKFVSKGFGKAAMLLPDGVGCHVVLALDAKGKPLNAQVTSCDKPTLEKSAVNSLMKSKYKPAKLNGKEVPVRMTVLLIYDGFGPHKELEAGSPGTPSKP